MRELREVFYVDGVRTAFGRAGPKGVFWRTRADDLDAQIVGPRAPDDALRARPAERGADAVDVEILPQLAHVKSLVNRHTLATLA